MPDWNNYRSLRYSTSARGQVQTARSGTQGVRESNHKIDSHINGGNWLSDWPGIVLRTVDSSCTAQRNDRYGFKSSSQQYGQFSDGYPSIRETPEDNCWVKPFQVVEPLDRVTCLTGYRER
jgi:hypothetical protein